MIKFHALLLILVTKSLHNVVLSSQTYPGTETRPILSDDEAKELTQEKYLSPWTPNKIQLPRLPDYEVGKHKTYFSIQEAVNVAILENQGSMERKFILINKGVYKETVFVPSGTPPITFYGEENSKIVLNLAADMNVTDWINQVNPNGTRYQEGDPAYSIYKDCTQSKTTIGTRCTSVVWIKSNKFHLVNIIIENSSKNVSNSQAVALKTDADEIQLQNVSLLGHQDTFYVASGTVFVNNSYLEGDVDYVCGKGTAVFCNCTFYTVSDRKNNNGYIFAPKTDPSNRYGFLVTNSIITSDKDRDTVRLARPWDPPEYIPDESANGQILIKNSRIDAIVNVTGPWGQGIGSQREFLGNINDNRDLNDNRYNRFWEYQNYGNGT